ncbi:MAG: NADH-quinone oxidoreductase subunit M [Bacteriovoracaceae bacterium]|nr:NADH-quinone oxidoreductase subunit M [Bacteriovoracaceae bacterium]
MNGILNWILWLPVIGMVGVILTPKAKEHTIKMVTLVTTSITLLLSVLLYLKFDTTTADMQFVTKIPWISQFHINYFIGIDGITMLMAFLNALLFFICTLSSWTVTKNLKAYFALLLMLQSTVFGVFFALDFFLFYVYWEVMLLPMFFLIGIWGGENREYAAIKFFLYTFFGSIFMLVGIIALYYASGKGVDSFNILALQGGKFVNEQVVIFGKTFSFETIFFWFMFLGFAIKVPVFPFHTWLPHAHVQAPTAVSVILAGVLLKMGTYGFLRIAFPIFPQAAVNASTIIAVLGLISVIYGAFCAMAQDDVKKLVAYSSVSHMGFVMLGLAAMTTQGMNGAVLQMFNHGTSTAMMFLMIGVLYERSHHRWIVKPDGSKGYGGLATKLPKYTTIFIIGMFASLGLPGLSGFISEALIFLGIYQKFTTITVIAVVGLLIGAAYLLWMFKRMFFGEVNPEIEEYEDMNAREVFYMIPLCIAVIVFGIFPSPLLNVMKASVGQLVDLLSKY